MSVAGTKAIDQPLEGIRRQHITTLVLLLAGIAIVTMMTWQSVHNMLSVWWNHSAYNHGLFIIPISLYLAWGRRDRLAGLPVATYWPGLFVIGAFALTWLAARGASIMEGEQIAYVGMVQGLMLTILGRKIFRAQLLPILYLWLMVPTGSFLQPPLQAVATWLTGFFLQFTSIPFFIEEFYIQLPVGLFEVAPGCAGLNFLLAALALSILYADMMYAGWQRKMICVLTWLGVAILANGVRIFGILVIAELSDMKLAIVDDHLLYGWGFFFVILIGLMLAGRQFSNIPPWTEPAALTDWMPANTASTGQLYAVSFASIFIAGAITGYGNLAFSEGALQPGVTLTAPDGAGEWRRGSDQNYSPITFPNADARHMWQWENSRAGVNLFAAFYAGQWEGHEAVSDNPGMYGSSEIIITGRAAPAPMVNGAPRKVVEETVSSGRGNILIWRWYCDGSHFTSRASEVRMRTALNRLFMRDTPVTVFILSSNESATAREDMAALMQALSEAKPGLIANDAQGNPVGNSVCW